MHVFLTSFYRRALQSVGSIEFNQIIGLKEKDIDIDRLKALHSIQEWSAAAKRHITYIIK